MEVDLQGGKDKDNDISCHSLGKLEGEREDIQSVIRTVTVYFHSVSIFLTRLLPGKNPQ